ncbi:MAG: hypothetical protein RJA18_1723 [Pseudomonadota bacterium]
MQAGLAVNTVGSMPGYIKGSCAWQGKEIQESPSWIVRWTAAQIVELESAADHFMQTGITLENITTESFPVATLKPFIADVLHELMQGRGFVMLRGLPIQNWTIEKAATIYMGIGRHMGSLRSSNGKGHLLGHVRDQGAKVEAGARFCGLTLFAKGQRRRGVIYCEFDGAL